MSKMLWRKHVSTIVFMKCLAGDDRNCKGKRNGLESRGKFRKISAPRKRINKLSQKGTEVWWDLPWKDFGVQMSSKKLWGVGYNISSVDGRRESERTEEQRDGTPSSPNCDKLLCLEGINCNQTKEWFDCLGFGEFFVWLVWFGFLGGAVVLVRSSDGFKLHTLAALQVSLPKA